MEDANTYTTCPHPACDEIAVALAAIALGEVVASDEQQLALGALASCARCRMRLDGYAAVGQVLPLTVPELAPPAELRERIMAAAARTPQVRRDVVAAPRPRFALPRWLVARPALALALALLIALGIGQQVQLRQQQAQIAQQRAQSTRNVGLVLAAFGNDDAVEGTLAGTDAAPGASGRYFLSPGEPALAIYVKGLTAPRTGSEYQVWVVAGGVTVSANTFSVNPEGRAWRLAAPPLAASTIERVFITIEPIGGSAQPSGPIVLQ